MQVGLQELDSGVWTIQILQSHLHMARPAP